MLRVMFALLLSGVCLGANPDLIGGRVVNKADFPEVIRIKQNSATCSAAVVGPRVVLTAAHCSTPEGEIVPISNDEDYLFEIAAVPYRARCTLSPAYRSGDHDMALCLVDRDVRVAYATLSPRVPQIGETVTIAGYGCTRGVPSPGGGNNGELKAGDVRVTDVPGDVPGSYWFTTVGNVAACFGDSGGPVFEKVQRGQPHVIVGVVSRGNIKNLSLLTSVGLRLSKGFMVEFAEAHAVDICGVTKQCGSVTPSPK